ncbi:hypothetical protein Tco_0299101, partial [Tanacetum coccineum]
MDHDDVALCLQRRRHALRIIFLHGFGIEFDIEIKDKKGTENVVADHLSRIENDKTSDDSDVDDNFPGKTLMEITTRDIPRYGYIKNYKKTVKNEQARTRESEEYKAEA